MNILTLALPLVILQVYDRIIPGAATDTFAFLVLGLVIVVVLEAVLRTVRGYIIAWAAARFEHATLRRAVDRLLSTEIEAFENVPAGTHLDRLSAIEPLRDFHSGNGLLAISELPFVFIFLGLIAVIGGPLVFAPIAVVLLAGIAAFFVGISLDRAVRRRAALDDQRYNFIFQVLSGIHSVKGLGLEAQILRRYQAYLRPLSSAVADVARLSGVGQAIGATFGNLAMFAVAAIGSVYVVQGAMTGGTLIASTLLAGRAVQPLIRMIGVWVQARNLKLSEERLDALMALPQEYRPDTNETVAPNLDTGIVLENITVNRGESDVPVLGNISLEIPAGSIVVVTGAAGSGQSTLLDLMAGLTRPDAGRLLIDGIDSDHIDMRSFRGKIGFARENMVLFRGTVLDNLTTFQGRSALPMAIDGAHSLALDEVIARMPNGLQTKVGDTASDSLAGSIKQLIALVRAFAGEPRLLLLDEANSALDLQTDRKLLQLLEKLRGRTTIILVTSRPSLMNIADLEVSMDRGRIIAVRERDQQNVTANRAETVTV
ncbi:MAG: ATP-binding cassette domain-containing protein [Rhodospirillaceae bacterium]|nr:ATP-binding cassette domain-containing protein [Rhodospirillaceae bacterium]MBT5810646.1 ATP-binding cassette domain-containing protein [Rhodospirillaceae bacterium]